MRTVLEQKPPASKEQVGQRRKKTNGKNTLARARTPDLKLKSCTQAIGPAPCVRLCVTHGARCAVDPNLDTVMNYPQPVSVQTTQGCGKPCGFGRDTYEKEAPTFRN